MAKSNLTAERLRHFLDYNPETGLFTRVKSLRGKRVKAGSHPCYVNEKGYGIVCLDGKDYRLHRLAWFFIHGAWPEGQIDHKNGNKLDNRIDNLREASNAENHQNITKANFNNLSGFLGASKKRNKWRAQIMVRGKVICLGVHETPELAHAAYISAKRIYHPFGTI